MHHGMLVTGLQLRRSQEQMRLDEVTGGAPYGATTIAGGDGSRQVSDNEKAGARFLGKHVAGIAARLTAAP